jgi:hypothetical protein
MLKHEEKMKSPLLLVFLLHIIVFYQLRVATLLYDPLSLFVLNPNSVLTHKQFNITLSYLFICIWLIFLGLSTNKRLAFLKIRSSNYEKKPNIISTNWLILFILAFYFVPSLYFQYFTQIGASGEFGELSKIDKLITTLFRQEVILIIFFVYMIYYKHVIKKHHYLLLVIMSCLIPLISMMGGNRSGVAIVLIYIFFSYVSVNNKFIFRKWVLFTVPFILTLILVTYYMATVVRNRSITIEDKKNVIGILEVAMSNNDTFNIGNIRVLIRDPISRIGFLDMAADVMYNASEYSKIINVSFETKATLEGLLPGVHLFNTGGRTANQFRNVVEGIDIYQTREIYRSDAFTLFGEYYVLFGGILSLIVIFGISMIFKVLYLTIGHGNNFTAYYSKAILLNYFFFHWLCSFGTDWLINEAARTVGASVIFLSVLYFGNKIRWPKFFRRPIVGVEAG